MQGWHFQIGCDRELLQVAEELLREGKLLPADSGVSIVVRPLPDTHGYELTAHKADKSFTSTVTRGCWKELLTGFSCSAGLLLNRAPGYIIKDHTQLIAFDRLSKALDAISEFHTGASISWAGIEEPLAAFLERLGLERYYSGDAGAGPAPSWIDSFRKGGE